MRKTNQPTLLDVLSIVFHPLTMTTQSVYLLFIYSDFKFIFEGQKFRILLPIFALSCILPALSVYFLKKAKFVGDYDTGGMKNRIATLLVVLIPYSLLFYHFYLTNIYSWFIAILVVPIALLLINMVVNLFGKISLHMLGIGSLLGTVLSVSYNVKHVDSLFLVMFVILLSGILGVVRLYMNRDTPTQVYVGFIVGTIVSYFCVYAGANVHYIKSLFIN